MSRGNDARRTREPGRLALDSREGRPVWNEPAETPIRSSPQGSPSRLRDGVPRKRGPSRSALDSRLRGNERNEKDLRSAREREGPGSAAAVWSLPRRPPYAV